MKLEYFYNSIQLFGILLGLIGIFVVFKIQSLDANISSYRNNIVTAVAQYEANKAKVSNDESSKRPYSELVLYYFLVYNGHTDESLPRHVEKIIDELNVEKESIGNYANEHFPLAKEYFPYALNKWVSKRNEKTKIISSIKYPIISSAGVILLGLSITTYNSFELVNDILKASFLSKVILFFIAVTFINIIYVSKYIINALTYPQE